MPKKPLFCARRTLEWDEPHFVFFSKPLGIPRYALKITCAPHLLLNLFSCIEYSCTFAGEQLLNHYLRGSDKREES